MLSGAYADTENEHEDQALVDTDRYTYQLARPDDPDVPTLQIRIMRSIANRERCRTALAQARAGPVQPTDRVPATEPAPPLQLAA